MKPSKPKSKSAASKSKSGAKSPSSRKGGKGSKDAAPKKKKAAGPRRKKALHVEPTKQPIQDNPAAQQLARKIAALVSDKKALDVVILDVRGMTSYADYFVVASGESERQVSAMAEHVETTLRAADTRPVGSEGYDTGHWVLLDYGEVVAHLFFTEMRSFYDLEGLWADAPREKVA